MSEHGSHTRLSIEAAERPQIAVQFTGHGEEEAIREALDGIGESLATVVEKTGIKIGTLRLLHFTSSMDDTVRYWQDQLGLPVNGVTALAEGEGEVAGKHFIWGDGKPETTHAIVVLSDFVLKGLASGEGSALSTLAHEIGHVDDAGWRLLQLGHQQLKHPMLNDWSGFKLFLADMMWSECAANLVASMFMTEREIEESREYWVKMLTQRRARISAAIDAYRKDGDMGALWMTGHANMAVITTQLGRAVGDALSDHEAEKKLVEATRAVCDSWGALVDEFLEALAEMASCAWTEKKMAAWSLEPLQPLISRAFHIEHLVPVEVGDRLRIDVPPRNEQERLRVALARAFQHLL
jgi:hypothetical protein